MLSTRPWCEGTSLSTGTANELLDLEGDWEIFEGSTSAFRAYWGGIRKQGEL